MNRFPLEGNGSIVAAREDRILILIRKCIQFRFGAFQGVPVRVFLGNVQRSRDVLRLLVVIAPNPPLRIFGIIPRLFRRIFDNNVRNKRSVLVVRKLRISLIFIAEIRLCGIRNGKPRLFRIIRECRIKHMRRSIRI